MLGPRPSFARRPCGPMDKALVLGATDCRPASCQDHMPQLPSQSSASDIFYDSSTVVPWLVFPPGRRHRLNPPPKSLKSCLQIKKNASRRGMLCLGSSRGDGMCAMCILPSSSGYILITVSQYPKASAVASDGSFGNSRFRGKSEQRFPGHLSPRSFSQPWRRSRHTRRYSCRSRPARMDRISGGMT